MTDDRRYRDPTMHARFTPVPDWLACRTELPAAAKLVFSRIERYYVRDHGHAKFTVSDIARDLGLGPRTVFEALDRLHVIGLLEIVRQGKTLPNVYRFPVHPWCDDRVAVRNPHGNEANLSADSANLSADVAHHPTSYLLENRETGTETNSMLAGVRKAHSAEHAAQREERLMNAFRDLWTEHVGAREAKALTVSQMREAVDGWNRAIEIGRGELIVEAIKKAATDAETNRWRYFRAVLAGMLKDAQRERGNGEPAAGGEERLLRARRLLSEFAAGREALAPAVAAARALVAEHDDGWEYDSDTYAAWVAEARAELARRETTNSLPMAVYDDARYLMWQQRRDAGEELSPGVLAMLTEWEVNR